MDRIDTSLNNSNKPSKLLAFLALMTAFALPFILVKIFPHKPAKIAQSTSVLVPILEKPLAPAMPPIAMEKSHAPPTVIPPPPPQPQNEWLVIQTKPGDTLGAIFKRAKIDYRFLVLLQKENVHGNLLTQLKPNQDIQLQIKNKQLVQMILPLNTTQYLSALLNKNHYSIKIHTKKMNAHNHFLTATVQGSLYATAQKLKIPSKLVRQMTEIFLWDINFSKDVHPGDRFTIVYKAFYIEDKLVGTGDILAVSYHTRKQTFQAVRHINAQGQTNYYSPQGQSLKKAFNRYPLRFSHISSAFSLSRYHPKLHYKRMHKGVDLAAPIGTPIQATGDGRIAIIGPQNGYGNMIKINHNRSYSTIYGHMLKFKKGLSKGDYVKRGQVIGYVGQTGLATGPHCHYEFRINNQAKNPSTIPLPRGNPISGKELASFKAHTQTLLAELHLYEKNQLLGTHKKALG